MNAFTRSKSPFCFVMPIVLLTGVSSLISTPSAGSVDVTLTGRLGYDSNVTAVDEGVVDTPRAESTVYAAGLTAAFDLTKTTSLLRGWAAAKVGAGSEFVRYDDATEEDYFVHRLTIAGKRQSATDVWTVDGSLCYINGAESTNNSTTSCNAFGLSTWRERRTQWQERARVQWTHLPRPNGWRLTANSLGYAMQTEVRAGRVAFVDRSDRSLTAEYGRKLPLGNGWTGVQIGRQTQGTTPLPGGAFEYSNHYRRLVMGWGGKTHGGFSYNVSAGPDWRHYKGNVQRTSMPDDTRDSWFLDADASWEVSPHWSFTARAARYLWVASTGKSAYADTSVDFSAAYKASKQWVFRVGAKAQQADYFPAVRDDWMGSFSASVDYAVSAQLKAGADLLRQSAWTEVRGASGRDFERTTLFLRIALTL